MINPQSVQTLILNIQDNLTTLANNIGSLGDSFELLMSVGSYESIIDMNGRIWIPKSFSNHQNEGSVISPDGVRNRYPMYPFVWNTVWSNDWRFIIPAPNGVYQFAYWFINPLPHTHPINLSITRNGTLIQPQVDVDTFCGGFQTTKRVVYPAFQAVNNEPINLLVNEASGDCPITAFELYKIGEIP